MNSSYRTAPPFHVNLRIPKGFFDENGLQGNTTFPFSHCVAPLAWPNRAKSEIDNKPSLSSDSKPVVKQEQEEPPAALPELDSTTLHLTCNTHHRDVGFYLHNLLHSMRRQHVFTSIGTHSNSQSTSPAPEVSLSLLHSVNIDPHRPLTFVNPRDFDQSIGGWSSRYLDTTFEEHDERLQGERHDNGDRDGNGATARTGKKQRWDSLNAADMRFLKEANRNVNRQLSVGTAAWEHVKQKRTEVVLSYLTSQCWKTPLDVEFSPWMFSDRLIVDEQRTVMGFDAWRNPPDRSKPGGGQQWSTLRVRRGDERTNVGGDDSDEVRDRQNVVRLVENLAQKGVVSSSLLLFIPNC